MKDYHFELVHKATNWISCNWTLEYFVPMIIHKIFVSNATVWLDLYMVVCQEYHLSFIKEYIWTTQMGFCCNLECIKRIWSSINSWNLTWEKGLESKAIQKPRTWSKGLEFHIDLNFFAKPLEYQWLKIMASFHFPFYGQWSPSSTERQAIFSFETGDEYSKIYYYHMIQNLFRPNG